MRTDLLEAYVDIGPAMVKWFDTNSEVVFEIVENFPDYHPENPGETKLAVDL